MCGVGRCEYRVELVRDPQPPQAGRAVGGGRGGRAGGQQGGHAERRVHLVQHGRLRTHMLHINILWCLCGVWVMDKTDKTIDF